MKSTTRHACDRCHGHKLRCIHNDRSAPCLRCTRARTECVWSRSLRSRKSPPPADDADTANAPRNLPQEGVREPQTLRAQDHNQQSACIPASGQTDTTTTYSPPVDSPASPLSFTRQTGAAAYPWSNAMNMPVGSAILPSSALPECVYNNTQGLEPQNGSSESPAWMWQGPNSSRTRTSDDVPSQENWQQIFQHEWAMLSHQPGSIGDSASPDSVFGNGISNNLSSTNSTTSSHDINPSNDTKGDDGAHKAPCIVNTIRQLSELNVELFAHAALVPKPPTCPSQPVSWKGKDFAIDRMLQLSQKFIHILNTQYPRYLVSATMAKHAHSLSSSPDAAAAIPPDASSPLLDQGCLLILSCYLRLVDTYDDVFGNMQSCLDRSSITREEDYVPLPGVQVGSFELPQSSALQIVLILQLSRHLLSRIGEIFRAAGMARSERIVSGSDGVGTELGDGSDGRDLHSLITSAIDTVSSREQRLMERIARLRSTLIEMNIL